MFDNLSVRNKFLAVAAVPANVLVVVALWAAAIVEEPVMAAVASVGAVLTLFVAHRSGSSVGGRMSHLAAKIREFDVEGDVEVDGDVGSGAGDEVGDTTRALTELGNRLKGETERRRAGANERLQSMMHNVLDRNRRLIDSQLDLIDWLEATEEDGDRLEHLFELDHLANRMRRNGDSIMVLAGAEAANQRREPAPVADVLRVAMGYNSRYRDIGLRTIDEVLIEAEAAWETTHLVSELLENATQFSPDEALVEIHATFLDDGSYRITIIDHGHGMSDQQLAAAALIISDPPDLDLTDAKSIGLQVAGRLAAKLPASVELSRTAGSGVTVEILLPAHLVVGKVETRQAMGEGSPESDTDPDTPIRRTQTQHNQTRRTRQRETPAPDSGAKLGEWVAPTVQRAESLSARSEPGRGDPEPVAPPATVDAASPAHRSAKTLNEALGADADFDAGVENLLIGDETGLDASAGRAAAEELGLTRRKRGSGPRIAGPGGTAARASTRKPEEVRSMITQYRDGLKGRAPDRADNDG